MNASNIFEHETAKWADLKKWHDKEQAHQEGIKECWPHIAKRMSQLRDAYKSDNEFGSALLEHGIEYNAHDRAAFIWMGRLKPEALEDAMELCDRSSPRLFRKEVESWPEERYKPVWQAAIPTSETPEPTKTPEITMKTQEIEETKEEKLDSIDAQQETEEQTDPTDIMSVAKDWSPDKRNKLLRTLTLVHKKKGVPLVEEAYRLGLLTSEGTAPTDPSGALLLNTRMQANSEAFRVLSGYDLSKLKGCKDAEEQLMPVLRKFADDLRQDPYCLGQKMREYIREKNAESMKAAQEVKAFEVKKAMDAAGEKPVIVCGETVWPPRHTNIRTYSYEQLRQAWFLFLDVEGVAQANIGTKEGRHSRAIGHRFVANKLVANVAMFKDTEHHAVFEHMEFVASAYRELARALQVGEDTKLQTSIPWHDIRIAK
jgi:hypothetical protein